jgi:hypothetical protein
MNPKKLWFLALAVLLIPLVAHVILVTSGSPSGLATTTLAAMPQGSPSPTPTGSATPSPTPPPTPTPPAGNEGCSPGFWQTHTGLGPQADAWLTTSFTHTQTLASVFTGFDASISGTGLLDALTFTGPKNTLVGAEKILAKQAVAALLNSSSSGVNYPLSTSAVIAEVNAALASGDRDTILTEASRLDGFNGLEGGICGQP